MVGRLEEGVEVTERGLRVAPPELYTRENGFRHFYFARQYERALQEAERARELIPGWVDLDLGTMYVTLGRSRGRSLTAEHVLEVRHDDNEKQRGSHRDLLVGLHVVKYDRRSGIGSFWRVPKQRVAAGWAKVGPGGESPTPHC